MAKQMPMDGAESSTRLLIALVRRQPGYGGKQIARAMSISGWILAQAGALSEGMGLKEEMLSQSRAKVSSLAGQVLKTAAALYPDMMEQVAFVRRSIQAQACAALSRKSHEQQCTQDRSVSGVSFVRRQGGSCSACPSAAGR